MLDLGFFKELLSIDSTTGKEEGLCSLLAERFERGGLASMGWKMERMSAPGGIANLLFSTGEPEVVFCTHLDTVPPYIPPAFTDSCGKPCAPVEAATVWGRGACDAKGQILSMWTACEELASEGATGIGLLLLSGEETGSFGAKAFAAGRFRAPVVIVGEPTENKMASAAKGTKAYDLEFMGEAFHSGYPEFGVSAVELFIDFMDGLRSLEIPEDPVMGKTTWNVGALCSDNPKNILSPSLRCQLYFRTTAVSDAIVEEWMLQPRDRVKVTARGGDKPSQYLVCEGFDSAPVSFGSDAPHLINFERKAICGPGSIRYAHRSDENVTVAGLEEAVRIYKSLFKTLTSEKA